MGNDPGWEGTDCFSGQENGNNSLWERMDIHFNLALSLENFGYTESLIQMSTTVSMAAVSFQWLLNSWPRKSGRLNAILTSWTYQKGANCRIFNGKKEEHRQVWACVHSLRECWENVVVKRGGRVEQREVVNWGEATLSDAVIVCEHSHAHMSWESMSCEWLERTWTVQMVAKYLCLSMII